MRVCHHTTWELHLAFDMPRGRHTHEHACKMRNVPELQSRSRLFACRARWRRGTTQPEITAGAAGARCSRASARGLSQISRYFKYTLLQVQ